MGKPGILIFVTDLSFGGVEKMRLKLARYWLSQGCEVSMALLYNTGELLDECIGLVGRKRIHILLSHSRRQFTCIMPLAKLLRQLSPDLVLVSCWPLTVYSCLAGLAVSRKSKIIVSEHTNLLRSFAQELKIPLALYRISAGLLYYRASAIVGVSNGISSQLSKLLPCHRNSITTVYNPAFVPESADSLVTDSCFNPDLFVGKKIILSVGELKRQKNYGLLIESFSLIVNKNLVLVIVGEGSERPYLQDLIASRGLTDNVFLPGYSSNVSTWYARSDLFVLSSGWEGFANVIVEALSFGLSVVSTDCDSGPAEILMNGQYGTLVPLDNPLLMANAIKSCLRAPFPPELLKLRAREFSVEVIADQYLRLANI